MQRKTPKGGVQATRSDVEKTVAGWLEEHDGDLNVLSAWESHCFAMLLTFLRYGYYDRALDQFGFIMDPPIPLPVFPLHNLMTLEQVKNAFPQVAPARSRHRGDGDGDGDGASDD